MPTKRDPWLDNAKMLLVTIVVVGHFIVLAPVDDHTSRVYDFVYYVHVPAFVLVTGYLSRSFRWSRRHLLSLVTTLVVPYFFFEAAMSLFRIKVGGETGIDDIWLNPHWPMWYLIVLVLWRLATPILLRHWVAVPLSIGVSLLAGLVSVELFDINRALGLLPFFVVGLHLTPGVLTLFQRRGARVAGLVVLAGIWWLAGRTDDWISTEWLYFRASYDELGASFADGVQGRMQLILIALAGTAAVLTLVPRGHSWFSDMGKYSLVVYLLHGFVVRSLEYSGVVESLPGSPSAVLAMTVVTGVAVALLLAWRPIAERLNYPVDPIKSLPRP